jgi:hypothetical protein
VVLCAWCEGRYLIALPTLKMHGQTQIKCRYFILTSQKTQTVTITKAVGNALEGTSYVKHT